MLLYTGAIKRFTFYMQMLHHHHHLSHRRRKKEKKTDCQIDCPTDHDLNVFKTFYAHYSIFIERLY